MTRMALQDKQVLLMLEAQLEYGLEAHKRGLGTLTREAIGTIGSGPNNSDDEF